MKTVPGWKRKQRGLLQSLWEQGWINEASRSDCTIDRKTDLLGIQQMSTSLKYLMANCTDFNLEESLLQSIGHQMGAMIDRTQSVSLSLWVQVSSTPGHVQRINFTFYLLGSRENLFITLCIDKRINKKIQGGPMSICVRIMFSIIIIIISSRQLKHLTHNNKKLS